MDTILNEILHLSERILEDGKKILKITQEIEKYIQQEEMALLNENIDQRQELINQTNINTKKLDNIIKDCSNSHEEKIIEYKHKKRQIYEKIYTLEKQNHTQGEKLLQDYKAKIINLHHGKKAMNTYGTRPMNQSIMLNKVK